MHLVMSPLQFKQLDEHEAHVGCAVVVALIAYPVLHMRHVFLRYYLFYVR